MKSEIRKEMLEKRDAHHSKAGHQLCLVIMDHLLRMREFDSAACVLLYASKGSEVHTDGLIRSALSLGKRVALPLTNMQEHRLELYEIHSISELSPGAFGILEPPKNPAREVKPDEIDIAVVPGISFDARGHRIGYGMGYYDFLLPKIAGKKVGLAYGLQMVKRVPEEPHDVAVDMVVTEDGIINCAQGRTGGDEYRVVVLASGRGSDFQSLVDAVSEGRLHAKIAMLITDNPQAMAIERAKQAAIPYFVLKHPGNEELDAELKKKLDELAPDLVVLAGYMKIIRNKELLSAYEGRMINIHPSLLPAYPGAHAQKDAFAAGEKESGYTIHFVDSALDGGPIIHQEKVDITSCRSSDEVAGRILEKEHGGLPMIVEKFAKGEIKQGIYNFSAGKEDP